MKTQKGASLLEYFSVLSDPRIKRGKVHKLIDIVVMAVCSRRVAKLLLNFFGITTERSSSRTARGARAYDVALDGEPLRHYQERSRRLLGFPSQSSTLRSSGRISGLSVKNGTNGVNRLYPRIGRSGAGSATKQQSRYSGARLREESLDDDSAGLAERRRKREFN